MNYLNTLPIREQLMEINKHLSAAQKAIEKRNYVEALAILSFFDGHECNFKEILELQTAVYCMKGFCWHMLSSLEKAAQCYEFALTSKGDSIAAITGLAEVRISQKKFHDAKALFEHALKIAPNNIQTRKGLVRVNKLLGINASDNSLVRDDIGDLPSVVEVSIYNNDVTLARKILFRILMMDPLHLDTLNNLSVCDIMEERIDDALKKIAMVLEIDPDNETANANFRYLQERAVAVMG